MSIKDLFGRKTVVVKNAESASVDAESNRFVLRKAEENETFVPPVDFTTASNFVRFGSAEEYYEASVKRIYSEYPYDGSAADKILFSLSSSYFDRHILEDRYPSSTGYGVLSPAGYGASSKTGGYGLNASSTDYEYIWIGGGIRPAPQNQHDPSSDDKKIPLYKKFRYGTFYEEGTDKTSVFTFTAASGSTFEFWMKKEGFDTAKTEKEVILDLWNGVATSSAQYGRITLELDATNEGGAGANPFRLTYQNGRVGISRQSLASGSFTTSDIADGKWHHWAISTIPRIDNTTTTNYLDLKLYKDGVVVNQQSIVTTSSAGTPQTIGNIVGRLDGYMGALIAPVWDGKSGSTTGAKYAGKLSASLDEVRFWKKRISSHEIYNNWYHPIGGGANTDENREHLALYYKFNEGITTTSSIDSVLLDYSGRVANGSWTGYSVNSRNTGSCFISASVLSHEPEDPIIRFNHQSVKDLISELKVSGSQYDLSNSAYMYDMVPFWMREEDFEVGDNNLKKMYQIIASYFDTLYLQIESLPDIKTKQYFTMDKKPYPFSKQLLEHNGLIVPDLFVSQGVLEKFSQRDDQNKKFEHDMDDLKKRIYYNIYNNLKTIYESKGTEKSYRNMLRCFGIDDEIVKLNLYTDYGIQYLTDKVKYSSQKTKFINHNVSANFTGRVYNTSSAGNPRTFISSSGPVGSRREKNLAFTLETDVIIPTKLKVGDLNYFPTDFLTSSIMGFHSASAERPDVFTWHGSDASNLQVHLVRPINESEDAKFVLTNNAKTIFAESETFKNIYNNERWAIGLKVYPVGYPWIGTVTTSSNPSYVAELYGVTHNLNEVQREFTITASMTYTQGSAMLANTKRFYAGCEATNFTGSAYHYSDLKIGACRLWYDKLDNAVLKQHNLDASNYGHNKIHGNPTPYVDGLKDVHIPSAEVLAFNWDFQQVTASDSNGRFVIEDFSSGTPADRYGWIDDLILRENRAGGFGYAASSKKVVDNEFIFSAKKELPEISFTSDGVFVKGDEEVYFSEDEDTTDNVFAFEKSMYQVVSEEMLKTFSTVTEYANLFMKPVDLYREDYKRLDHFKELYFERVEGELDFERFTNYYKFIDAAISIFIQQLHPAMAKFNEGISDMVESHILERPKYKRQFPLVVTRDTIPDGKMAGVKERKYPWREGHAPNYRETFDENDHCFWQKERRAIKPSGSHVRDSVNQNLKLDELRKVIVSETDGKAKNLGTTPPYSSYTITFGNGEGGGGIPAAGENITFAFPSVSLLVSFNNGGANETAFSESTANELKIDIASVTTAAAVAAVIRTALINYTGAGLGPTALDLAVIPALTANSSDRILVLTANRHGHYGLTFSDNAANIIITNISNTRRPNIYQGSTYAVRSFSRQYDFTYEEQKVIHGGTNYGHQKNRDFVLDHLKPHGGVSRMGVPQEVITVGVGKGLGILGLDKCKRFTDPYQPVSGAYTARHLEKAEYRFVGTVGRYADGTGDQPKSDEMDQLFKVKGHSSFPFNLVSGTIATGYNKKIHDKYDDDFILTNLHSDTTTPSNDVPMQGPFAEAWVGGRQHRHIPMNRYRPSSTSHVTRPRRALEWSAMSSGKAYADGSIGSTLTSPDNSGATISFWAKLDTTDTDTRIIAQIDPDPLGSVYYAMIILHEGPHLFIITRDASNRFYQRAYTNYFENETWTHTVLRLYFDRPIDGETTGTSPILLHKNGSLTSPGWVKQETAGLGAVADADKHLNNAILTGAKIRFGDAGNPNFDSNALYELINGQLQDFAIYNKALDTADWLSALYNNGKSIYPTLAPNRSRLTNWWLLGSEEELRLTDLSVRIPANQTLTSVEGSKSTVTFATHGGTPANPFVKIEEGLAGSRYSNNNLDDQFSRPEAYRILVGDHPSEPVADGAFGMVGPDYGGPYPDTARQMAVHYREERAKRPFNIKNIQYGTASAILGNFKENYEVVHSVGRSTNNRKLVEFASVSSSLTSPIGLILPQTTNQASLFGSTPLLSGNVFLAGDRNTSNRTLDRPRVERYSPTGVKASGSFFFRDDQYYYGGSFASGSLHVSGSTLYSRATGSFTMSGSHVSGAHAQGHFTLAYPSYTPSEGDFVFTGSFIHGAKASGSVTPAAPPSLTTSTGDIIIGSATTFGTPAVGSFKVGDMPALTTSSGSFEVARAFVAGTAAVNGAFTVAGRTTYETQYTGSFKLQGPAVAAARGYANFKVKGTTMTDGHNMTINLGGTSKQIVANTTSGSSGGDITLEAKNSSSNTIKTIRSDSQASSFMRDTSFSGIGTSDFTVSFWHKPFDANSDELNSFTRVQLGDGAGGASERLHVLDLDTDVKITVENTIGGTSTKTFDTNWSDTTDWVHVTAVFPVNDLSSCDPLLYINGQPFTTTTGAAYSAPGGLPPTLVDLDIVLDDAANNTAAGSGPAMHDFVIWNKTLTSAEALEAYASGYYYDVSTHSAQGNIVSWWKLGREADFNSFNDGDELSGVINLASSHGTTSNSLEFVYENEFRIEDHRWDNHTGNKTNTQIFDNLKTDLTTAYSDWKVDYRDIGGNEAEFFAQKKVLGSSGATTSISVAGGSTTFVSIANGNGADAIASNLKHGDNITIEGDQFDIFTTTSGSSFPHVNAANTVRKALRFNKVNGVENTAVNSSYTDPTSTSKLSVSWWMKIANLDSDQERVWEFDHNSGNHSFVGMHSNTLRFSLYDDGGSNVVRYRTNALTSGDLGKWQHYTFVFSRTNADAETPILYVNGVATALTNYESNTWSNTNPVPITEVHIGDDDASNALQQNGGLQDFAIWNTELTQYDAIRLYNSGSWMNLHSHASASAIWDWWMLGNESNIGQASGSALNTGTAVTSIQPTIGLHALTFNTNANVIVTNGTADAWKSDGTIFAELKTSIAAHTLYQEAVNGVSTINFTTSGNTGTFTLTDTLPSAPTAFSNNANQGFHTLVGPTANGLDISVPTGGSTDGHYVDVGSVRFYVDSDNSHAGGNYAENGGDYYVYSNAADDATWWTRFATAVNAGVTTHTTTRADGVFDVDADAIGTAGNMNITSNGDTFSATAHVAGGTDEVNNGDGRGVRFGGATGSLDGNANRDVYVYTDLASKIAGASGTVTFIQDGVWLNENGSNRHYFVSSTGSSAGSSGTDSVLWQRVTASMAHGLNSMVGAPAVTSSPNSSFKITNLGGGSFGARIEFTGSYTLTNGHDFAVSSVSAGSSGPAVISIVDANVNGHGRPYHGSVSGSYDSRPDFSVDGVNFRFTYPYNSYNAGGNIALRPTGSKAALMSHMQSLLEANVPNFNFTTEGDRICMTGSMSGSALNNRIVDNAFELVEHVTQTAGGTFETGAGHGRGVYINFAPSIDADVRIVSVQTMASASSLNPNATLLANGIMWDNSGIATSIKEYYISSTGSTGVKTNGVNEDYWSRWRTALAHAAGTYTGVTGSWTRSGGSSTINFVGGVDSTDTHNFTFSRAAAIYEAKTGPLFGGAEAVSNYANPTGFGDPGANYKNSRLLTVDGVTFENVYPYDSYASSHGTAVARRIRHTGSLAFYRAALNATMSANLPNLTNFTVSDPKITFNATVTGSHRNQAISTNFFGASKEDIAGGFAHEGVGSNARMNFNFANAGGVRAIMAHDDLRNHPSKGFWTYVHDGIWRTSTPTTWNISTTGSAAGSNLTQAEWVRRVHKTFHLIVSGSGLSPVPNYTINIFSGSSDNNFQHQFNITGSLTASNVEEITTIANAVGGTTDRRLYVSSDSVDGFGRFDDGGAGHTNVQRLVFANDDTGAETFRFTVPAQGYAKDPSEIGIRATGSVAAYFNRVSQSLDHYLTNYTILNITDMGSNTRKFTIRANQTGSVYNSDITEDSHLVSAISAMSGGHLQYNKFDEDWILLAHSGSGNHLFKLDHDGNQPVITTGRTHEFTVTVDSAHGKFALNGELVTGSTYVSATDATGFGKQQPDLVLVRGSIYRFKQPHATNYPAGTDANHHPIIFHTSPIEFGGSGSLSHVTSSWAASGETPVRYVNDGSDVTYAAYLSGMDGNANDYVILSASSTTPDRLFYGCGNHGNMGGRIYVVDSGSVHYSSTAGANAHGSALRLRNSIEAAIPRIDVGYNDALGPDQAQTGTPTSDDYLPEVVSYLIKMTGSTVSGSFDDTLIIASGSSWGNIHQMTGAMTYLEGQAPGQSLNIGWGIHPDTSNRRFKTIGIGGLFNEDPFVGISDTDDRSQDLYTSVYTGSHTINMVDGAVPLTDPYYLSSSAFWNNVSASIMNTGQYTIESMTDSGHRKYKIFKIVSKYRQERFNFNHYSGSLAATTPANSLLGGNPAVLNVTGNFFGHGFYTSSVDGLPRNTRQLGAGIIEGGFSIHQQILGAKQPAGINLTHAAVNTAIQFQTGFGETIRIRGDATGWRDRVGDPAKTIYWDWWGTGTNGNTSSTATEVRSNLSGAWSKLTASNGVPYYQIVSSVGGTATIPANSTSPYSNFYALTASTTGSEFNFIVPADLAPFGSATTNTLSKHISGSQAMHGGGGNGTDANKITPERHGSHYVTGGVTFKPIEYYSSRVNVNPREQALLEDGDRNKTIITSRFYGGGGPEVMTEAFLDVHAKEKSVYSSLPYRNLLIKNDSGEAARFVHETDEYGKTVIYAASASVSVTSHAGRREGLNTLHSRHTGRFGVDSRHGTADSSDYASPVLRRTFDAGAQSFSDTGGGGYEASFHKVHRNTFVRPDVSTALRHPPTAEAVVGLLSADIGSGVTYPSSGQMSLSFWVRFDETTTSEEKFIIEADDNDNVNCFIVTMQYNRLYIYRHATNGTGRRKHRTQTLTGLKGKWNNFCVVWSNDDVTAVPTVYFNADPVTTELAVTNPGTATGAQRTIAGRISLTGNDFADTENELQGALQDLAFYNTGLTHAQANELYDQQDLYSVSFVNNIVEWWPLRSPVPTGVSPIGVEIPKDTKIFPAIGATVFITPPNIRGVPGRGKQPRRDNFYIQNILPQSDYNYSWVETSLGSNYSVRSGKQNVFGYWPKDGILVRDIKKGAKGTYYETQATASVNDSAINFPTGSDIFGSFES